MKCSVETCSKPARRRGWCSGHITRWDRYGDVMADIPLGVRRYPPGQLCAFTGCDRPVESRGLCVGHYSQHTNGRPLTDLRDRLSGDNRTADGECLTCVDACHLLGLGESVHVTAVRLGYTVETLAHHLRQHGHRSLVERVA